MRPTILRLYGYVNAILRLVFSKKKIHAKLYLSLVRKWVFLSSNRKQFSFDFPRSAIHCYPSRNEHPVYHVAAPFLFNPLFSVFFLHPAKTLIKRDQLERKVKKKKNKQFSLSHPPVFLPFAFGRASFWRRPKIPCLITGRKPPHKRLFALAKLLRARLKCLIFSRAFRKIALINIIWLASEETDGK